MDHLGKNPLHFVEAGDERIDFAEGVVEGERGAGSGGYVEEVHNRLCTMVAGAVIAAKLIRPCTPF